MQLALIYQKTLGFTSVFRALRMANDFLILYML